MLLKGSTGCSLSPTLSASSQRKQEDEPARGRRTFWMLNPAASSSGSRHTWAIKTWSGSSSQSTNPRARQHETTNLDRTLNLERRFCQARSAGKGSRRRWGRGDPDRCDGRPLCSKPHLRTRSRQGTEKISKHIPRRSLDDRQSPQLSRRICTIWREPDHRTRGGLQRPTLDSSIDQDAKG